VPEDRASEGGSDRRPAEQYTAEYLTRATRTLDLALSEWHGELAAQMRMGTGESLVLAHLAVDERQGPSELARGLHVTTGAMTALLDRLVERGHLVREPHPSDRRRVALRLTASAHEAARAHVRPMAAEITELAGRLSPEERTTVGRFLDELAVIVRRRGVAGSRGDDVRRSGPHGSGTEGSPERTT